MIIKIADLLEISQQSPVIVLFCDVTAWHQQLCAAPVEKFEMLLELKNYDCTNV